jgi:hypothetical protein
MENGMELKWANQLLTFSDIIIIIIYLNCKSVLPSGSGTTIRHNTQIHIPYKITHHPKATQTIKATLHTMNTMQKK